MTSKVMRALSTLAQPLTHIEDTLGNPAVPEDTGFGPVWVPQKILTTSAYDRFLAILREEELVSGDEIAFEVYDDDD